MEKMLKEIITEKNVEQKMDDISREEQKKIEDELRKLGYI